MDQEPSGRQPAEFLNDIGNGSLDELTTTKSTLKNSEPRKCWGCDLRGSGEGKVSAEVLRCVWAHRLYVNVNLASTNIAAAPRAGFPADRKRGSESPILLP